MAQRVRILHWHCSGLDWHRFNPWLWNFHMLWEQPLCKKKKKKSKWKVGWKQLAVDFRQWEKVYAVCALGS